MFPLTYNGKSGSWPLLLSHCRLQKCSLSSLLPNIFFLYKPLNLISCHGNRKAKFPTKNNNKNNNNKLLRSYKGNKAETLQKCLLDKPLQKLFLMMLVMCFHCYSN